MWGLEVIGRCNFKRKKIKVSGDDGRILFTDCGDGGYMNLRIH